MISMTEAIEVFVRGYCFGKSLTHPYVGETIDGLWVMRDAERKRGEYRKEEYVAHGLTPAKVDEIARRSTRGRYFVCHICAIGDPDSTLRESYRGLGYRLLATEPFFVHRLSAIPTVPAPVPIILIQNLEELSVLARVMRRRPLLPAHLQEYPPPARQYAAMYGEAPIAWVQSVVAGEHTWCSSLYVRQEYRRRGIGTALMGRMLADDRDSGVRANVLLASHAGARLYPTVGYEQIGELLMFSPLRERA